MLDIVLQCPMLSPDPFTNPFTQYLILISSVIWNCSAEEENRVALFFGILFIIISFIFFIWFSIHYQNSPMLRPLIFNSPFFIIFSFILMTSLFLGGFFLIFRSSLFVGFIFSAVVIIMFLLLRKKNTIDATKESMYKTYERIKNLNANSNIDKINDQEKIEHEKYVLFHTLEPRYRYVGKYSTETLLSIVNEYPTIESLTNFVILFEFFEEKYPGMDIEELREQVRTTLDNLKTTDSDLYSGIKKFIKEYQDYLTMYGL